MMVRGDEQVDSELDKLWERVDASALQLASITQQLSSIEAAIKTMAEATEKALSNLTVCAERGVELRNLRDKVTQLEQCSIDRREFNATVTTLRSDVEDLKKVIVRAGIAAFAILVGLVLERVFAATPALGWWLQWAL